jgi:hypothetical protein
MPVFTGYVARQARGTMVLVFHSPSSPGEYSKYDLDRCAVLQRVRVILLHGNSLVNVVSRPGHGQANLKSTVSINYNREISQQTCRWAIVEWLKDKNEPGIWKDVIASHFSIRQGKIRQK